MATPISLTTVSIEPIGHATGDEPTYAACETTQVLQIAIEIAVLHTRSALHHFLELPFVKIECSAAVSTLEEAFALRVVLEFANMTACTDAQGVAVQAAGDLTARATDLIALAS